MPCFIPYSKAKFSWKKHKLESRLPGEISITSDMQGFPGGSDVKASAWKAGDLGLIPESGRSPGVGNGNPLQYSCPEYLIDRGGLRATVHEVAKEVDMTETTR